MARVSLVLPATAQGPPPLECVPPLRAALERAGHQVEILVVADPDDDDTNALDLSWRAVGAGELGPAASAVVGLEQAEGDVLLVLDPSMGYDPDDLPRVVEPLVTGRADLAIASRVLADTDLERPGWTRAAIGWLARPLTGTTDPLSGLIGLTRRLRDEAADTFRAVGTKFSFELLAKLGGRWVDVPVRPHLPRRPSRPRFDDLRHLKRLADHRFGNLSRLVQFCVVGGSGMVVDLTCYFALQPVFASIRILARTPVPPTRVSFALALARASAIGIALCWNFSLNRRLTFSYARGGSLGRQFVTYVLSNALGVVLSLVLSLGLPRRVAFFHDHKLAAAVVGIVAATALSFSMSRWVVFGRRGGRPRDRDVRPAEAVSAL